MKDVMMESFICRDIEADAGITHGKTLDLHKPSLSCVRFGLRLTVKSNLAAA
jgi:hypothetical protein